MTRRSLCFGLYAQFTRAVACSAGDGVLCTVQPQVTELAWEQQVAVVCSLSFNGNYSFHIVAKLFLSQTVQWWAGRANQNGLSALIFSAAQQRDTPRWIHKKNHIYVTMGTGEGTSDEEYFWNPHCYCSCFNLNLCFPFVVATHAYIYLAFF